MKIKNFFKAAACTAALTAVLIAAPCCSFLGGNKPETDVTPTLQSISYTESTAQINNPDQGFYRPIYVKATEDGLSYNKNIVNASTQLYHLRIDISAFSSAVNGVEDKLFTNEVLDGLNELLSYLKTNEKNAVVRFAYDPGYGGEPNKEPDPQMILNHIAQVCPVLNNYETTITAIEVGLIGPWGEMHTSTIANSEHITAITKAFLDGTVNLPVLVRTPKMIYDYLGITVNDIDGYSIGPDDDAYRLGIFNDGYLGSGNDLGTYTDRNREIEFLSTQTAHLPYGGEVVTPSSSLHDIETCLPEMFKINLSYLDFEWDYNVINKWKSTTYSAACGDEELYYGLSAFDYIQNRMGYRFLITKSAFSCSDGYGKLTVELNFKNLGFGNLNKPKYAKFIFTAESGEAVAETQGYYFTGEESVSYDLEMSLDNGKYDVYMCVYGDEVQGLPTYTVQFANEDIWNATLKSNKIGELNILK